MPRVANSNDWWIYRYFGEVRPSKALTKKLRPFLHEQSPVVAAGAENALSQRSDVAALSCNSQSFAAGEISTIITSALGPQRVPARPKGQAGRIT